MRISYTTKSLILFLSIIILAACDGFIYDKNSDCTQGVYVSFYTQTACDTEKNYKGKHTNIRLLAFDENGILAGIQTEKNVELSESYSMLMPLKKGVYTFVAWTGLDNTFELGQLLHGVTSKRHVMLRLKKTLNSLSGPFNKVIFQGMSATVDLPNAKSNGSVFKSTSINLLEVSNRIDVEIELHESLKGIASINDFDVIIQSSANTMNIDGTMPMSDLPLEFTKRTAHINDNKLVVSFTTLDLKMGYNNRIILKNKKTDDILFSGDLIGSILMKNENINLGCQNDFSIKFVIKDKCWDCGIYVCWGVYVDNWQILSYDSEIGIDY